MASVTVAIIRRLARIRTRRAPLARSLRRMWREKRPRRQWRAAAFPMAALVLMLAVPPHAALAGGEGCLAPENLADADVARNAAALADPALCLEVRRFEENGVHWRLSVVRNIDRPGPLWAVPHDEEDAGFTSGVYAVRHYGGVLVAVENGERRLVDGIDPNQAFAATDGAAAHCPGARSPARGYIALFLDGWDRSYPVVGLHSNWDGYAGAGGLGTISVRRADDKMIPFASTVGIGRLADEDTVAMLVGTPAPDESDAARRAIGWFNDHGVHVIYRRVTEANNGCTLADYLTLNRLGPYFNLEVEHGDPDTQVQLIDILVEFLASPAYPGML